GESAAGKYPIESVKTMAKIAMKAEQAINYSKMLAVMQFDTMDNITNAISYATCSIAQQLNVAAIICVTHSGETARMISRFRPFCPIVAATDNPRVERQLHLSWGVIPCLIPSLTTVEEMFEEGVKQAQKLGVVKDGDIVVITAGVPGGISGTTNLLKVHTVGNVLLKGEGVVKGKSTAQVCLIRKMDDFAKCYNNGDIVVVANTTNEMVPYLKTASGIIVEESDLDCHAVTVGLALDIPVIVGAHNALSLLKNGSVVTVDANNGQVLSGTN
ncbi:MAG: pyruvate kinase, partial [Clostridiales bacterium]|nr:pyruvate kinase [Clostridiales bacterium]